jgi:simple sugar transport system permease protein
MAVEEQQAPLAEREAAPPTRGVHRAWPAVRGLLIGRPETGALFGAVVMFAFFSIWADNFLTRTTLAGMTNIAAELGIVAMAITLLMISGHFDLSVGSVLGLSSMLVPYMMVNYDYPSYLAFAVALAVALSIGFLNGLVVVTMRIPSFIVTLGALLVWRGVLLVVSKGFPVNVPQEDPLFDVFSHRFTSGPFAQFRVATFWFIAMVIVLSFLLLRTRFGNWIFASGGNERSARSMGVPVDRVWIILFLMTAAAACLTGLIQVGRFNTVEATRGQLLELQVIAAAVVGGARLNGGYGSILGTALGAFMVAMIQVGPILGGVQSYWLNVFYGGLIILAVVANQLLGRSRPQI